MKVRNGPIQIIKQWDLVNGKPKLMKHITYASSLHVLGCAASPIVGLMLMHAKALGVWE
jgi:hypothetical protein